MSSLSEEQTAIVKAIVDTPGAHFVSGPPGVGKSRLLRDLIDAVSNAMCLGPTNMVAIAMGGFTINKGFAIRVPANGQTYVYDDYARYTRREQWDVLRAIGVLFFDEISMCDPAILVVCDKALRSAKGVDEPFGGVKVVLVGDFHQLRYVSRSPNAPYLFELPLWHALAPTPHLLTHSFRQAGSRAFFDLLLAMRGERPFGPEEKATLKYICTPFADRGIDRPGVPVHLCTHNAVADRINREHLAKLSSPKYVSRACAVEVSSARKRGRDEGVCAEVDYVEVPVKQEHLRMFDDLGASERVTVCTDQRVLFTRTFRAHDHETGAEVPIANGMLGTVVAFKVNTPDAERKMLGGALEFGVLSARVVVTVQLDGGKLVDVRPIAFELREKRTIVAILLQLPFVTGWAISIHKSQGKTLTYVVVDIKELFEKGMLYTAVSRAPDEFSVWVRGGIRQEDLEPQDIVSTFYAALRAGGTMVDAFYKAARAGVGAMRAFAAVVRTDAGVAAPVE